MKLSPLMEKALSRLKSIYQPREPDVIIAQNVIETPVDNVPPAPEGFQRVGIVPFVSRGNHHYVSAKHLAHIVAKYGDRETFLKDLLAYLESLQ